MKTSNKVFGIDLGTTYSCVSYVGETGKQEIVPNDNFERTTPSVVWFDGSRVVVGADAKEATKTDPANVCSFIKRSMGDETFYAEYDGTRYSPEEISSFILRKLVQDASQTLGEEIRDVVITCPAYFFVKERNATKRARRSGGSWSSSLLPRGWRRPPPNVRIKPAAWVTPTAAWGGTRTRLALSSALFRRGLSHFSEWGSGVAAPRT